MLGCRDLRELLVSNALDAALSGSINNLWPIARRNRPPGLHRLCVKRLNPDCLCKTSGTAENSKNVVKGLHWHHYTKRIAGCQDETYDAFCKAGMMKEPYERLQEARKAANFDTPTEAASAYGWSIPTYLSHENGTRGLRPKVAERYAKAFRKPAEWLLYGKVPKGTERPEPRRTVRLVGYVAAGGEADFRGDELGEVDVPEGISDETVAVEIRGESLGSIFDRWIVLYDDVRRPVTNDLIGRLCVVGLADGRVLVKKIKKSSGKRLYHLISNTEDPILDVAVEWAAKVKQMVPR